MAENKPIAMNKDEGVKQSITSTGRHLAIVQTKDHGLFRLAYADGKSGSIPEKYSGRYTGKHLAQADLDKFVGETWDVAEEHTKRKSA